MIVHDLDGIRPRWRPAETNAPLLVDANAVLPFPIPFQGFHTIARRDAQVFETPGAMHLIELARRQRRYLLRNTPDELAVKDRLILNIDLLRYYRQVLVFATGCGLLYRSLSCG